MQETIDNATRQETAEPMPQESVCACEEKQSGVCESKKQSLGLGILGAVLGAMIGAAVCLGICLLLPGNLFLCGGFLIALCVYYGYVILRGKRSKCVIPVMAVATFIAGAVAMFICIVLLNMMQLGVLSGEMATYYAQMAFGGNQTQMFFYFFGEISKEVFASLINFWQYILASLLFEAAGVWFFARKAKRDFGWSKQRNMCEARECETCECEMAPTQDEEILSERVETASNPDEGE